jgi:hypothetical protein
MKEANMFPVLKAVEEKHLELLLVSLFFDA